MKQYKWDEWNLDEFKTLSYLNQDASKELIHSRMGRLFWVWKDDMMYKQRFARENGPYQARNLKFLRTVCPTARTVLDAGMNVASNTIEYATWAKEVHGFEPFPETFALAKENVDLNQHVELKGRYWDSKKYCSGHNPNHADGWFKLTDGSFASLQLTAKVTLYNEGLGDQPGILEMESHPNNAGQNCILTEKRRKVNKYSLHKVAVNTIDSFNFTDVDVIKIDCEGYERNVLIGASNTISTYRPIVQVEIEEPKCKKFGYSPNDLYDYFIKQIGNYSAYDYRGRKLPNTFIRIKGVIDVFFVPNEKSEHIVADTSDKKFPGMGANGFGKKKKDKPLQLFDTLFTQE